MMQCNLKYGLSKKFPFRKVTTQVVPTYVLILLVGCGVDLYPQGGYGTAETSVFAATYNKLLELGGTSVFAVTCTIQKNILTKEIEEKKKKKNLGYN